MRPIPGHITRSFHFFAAAQRLLGEEYLASLWKRGVATIYRWGANPDTCDDTGRNPLDLLQITLSRLEEIGRSDLVEGALDLLAEPLGYRVEARHIRSDKNSATREVLDVNTALGQVAQLLNDCLADGRIDDDERERLMPVAVKLVRQASELLDAIQKGRA